MFSFLRINSFLCYRVLFVALFLLLGFFCVGVLALQYFTGVSMFSSGSEVERDALNATLSFMSVLGFLTSFIMMFLMRERRNPITDRRQEYANVSDVERRLSIDRRA